MKKSQQMKLIKGSTDQFFPITQMIEMLAAMNQLSPTERLIRYTQNIMMIHQQYPLLIQVIHRECMRPASQCGEVVNKYISQLYQLIQIIVRDGVASGEFRPNVNPKDGAAFLVGMIDSYCMIKSLLRDCELASEQTEDEYFSQAIAIFMHGISRRTDHE